MTILFTARSYDAGAVTRVDTYVAGMITDRVLRVRSTT